jgi:hypothetical protein
LAAALAPLFSEQMVEAILPLFKEDFGTTASVFVMIVVIPALIGSAWHKRWPEVGETTLLVFSSAALISGAKILILTLCLTTLQLGPLGDDKPTLLLGGIATLIVAAREAASNWKKVAGF